MTLLESFKVRIAWWAFLIAVGIVVGLTSIPDGNLRGIIGAPARVWSSASG
jgi:hypothetical protein